MGILSCDSDLFLFFSQKCLYTLCLWTFLLAFKVTLHGLFIICAKVSCNNI